MTPDRKTLDEAIPHIMAAPKDGAMIERLCYRPDFGQRHYVDQIRTTREGGVENCRWAHTPWLKYDDGTGDPRIQVSILQRRVLDLVWSGEEDSAPHPGDTFIVDMDLSEKNLPEGCLLQAGSAVLKVSTKFNDACVKWKARYGADALEWVREENNIPYRLRGVLCEVYTDGVIENGAPLTRVG